jgi:hypothetical protein
MARNMAPVINHLYSQTIQYKIIPLACNNIPTELYNNHIEDNSVATYDVPGEIERDTASQ